MGVGFIGYRRSRKGDSEEIVRIFLECREDSAVPPPTAAFLKGLGEVSYTYAVDVVFPGGKAPCSLRGVDGILVLKKFYKLIQSLEERARERGNDRQKVLASVEGLLEHLAYTRNARDFTPFGEPKCSRAPQELADPECRRVAADR